MKDIRRVKDEEIIIDPFPAIVESEPSTILIFWFPSHRLYYENSFDELVIWLVALESMIHGQLELTLTKVAIR